VPTVSPGASSFPSRRNPPRLPCPAVGQQFRPRISSAPAPEVGPEHRPFGATDKQFSPQVKFCFVLLVVVSPGFKNRVQVLKLVQARHVTKKTADTPLVGDASGRDFELRTYLVPVVTR
jgi:hypothetical protein